MGDGKERPRGDAFRKATRPPKMIGNQYALAMSGHEGVNDPEQECPSHQRRHVGKIRGRAHAFGHAAVEPAL
jgi:hypothetical protein